MFAESGISPQDCSQTEKPGGTNLPGEPVSPGEASEDNALGLLKNPDATPDLLERLSRNAGLMKSRKVKLALAGHPHTPKHVSMPMLRHLFTFDLMQLALSPVVPPDVKRAAEDGLTGRMGTIPVGERLSL